MDIFTNIILKNVNNIKSIKQKKICGSIKELISIDISQSEVIQLGYVLEKSIKELCRNISSIKVIDITIINNIQIDLLFEKDHKLYYFEIKSNVNLDTEKTKKTYEKLTIVSTLLNDKYTTYTTIEAKVLCLRFPSFKETNLHFIKAPLSRKTVIGYKDFFELININMEEKIWIDIFNKISNMILQNRKRNIKTEEVKNEKSKTEEVKNEKSKTEEVKNEKSKTEEVKNEKSKTEESNIPIVVFNNINQEKLKFKNSLKPMFKWCGGKRDELIYIYKYMPPKNEIKLYIEPFVGGGAVYFSLRHSNNIINDIHPEVINFYKTAQNNLKDIYQTVSKWKNEEKEYYKIRDELSMDNNILKASRFYYLRKTCFRGMLRYNKNGKFNIPYGRYKTYNINEIDINNSLSKEYICLLKNTTIENKNFSEIFKMYNNENNFIFLDPPYDSEFKNYGFDNFDKTQQRKLSLLFKNTKNKCMLIISETDFIKKLYIGNDKNGNPYIKACYPKKYNFKIKNNRVGSEINKNHLIITNY